MAAFRATLMPLPALVLGRPR